MRSPLILLALGLAAQEPPARPALEYAGKPLRLDFACGNEQIQEFSLTCTPDEPCPVYLELSGIEQVGTKLFLTGNLHTSMVTLYSVLLASRDNGKTWTEAHERMRSAGLEQIQFFDFQTGWIAGQQLQELPRDPFFLVTSDGGESWRKRPVFSESRVGAIEQFAFESRTAGAMLIDRTQASETGARHELYETMTGGETWMVREVSSRPLKLRRPRLVNTDLRIRPSRATKSYHIERRQGEKWAVVASFLIEMGACQAQETPLAEPPPPTEAEAKPESEAGGVFQIGGPRKTPPPAKKRR